MPLQRGGHSCQLHSSCVHVGSGTYAAGCRGEILQNRSGRFLGPEGGAGLLSIGYQPAMVDCVHSFDTDTFDIGSLRLDSAPTSAKPSRGLGGGGKSQIYDFSTGQIAALFVLFAAIAAIPILFHPLPPLSDYINHLSRMRVIAEIG